MIREDKQIIEKETLNFILKEADYCVILSQIMIAIT
jgi:hypothetical protein